MDPLKMLIVDDEEIILNGIASRDIWRKLGILIIEKATSALHAQSALMSFAPDILFTDICMPGIDGLELMQFAKERCPRLVIVALSGYYEFQYAQRAMLSGARAYVTKPVDDDELMDVFSSILRDMGRRLPSSAGGPIGVAITYIHENCARKLTLEEVATVANMHPNTFCRKFTEACGVGFVEYLNAVRIERAKQLLRTTRLRVYEIGEHVGFADMSYFSRVFRNCTGTTPASYRESACSPD